MRDGGPAFPRPHSRDHANLYIEQEGMSLRDWLAGLAMQGEMAGCPADVILCKEKLATWAYEVADAMLAEREKEQNDGP